MKQLALAAAIVLLSLQASAQEGLQLEAVTQDGREVLLKSDNTWEFVQRKAGDAASSAVLSVVRVREMGDACGLDFRLLNNFGAKIRTLVPRLSVYNKEGVLFDSASLSFAAVLPTQDKYTSIQFTGVGCRDISTVIVSDAKHCRMGEIDMFNEEDGECLSHIYVEPSQEISITK